MAGVMQQFLVVSIFLCILPAGILYGLNNDLLPGSTTLSPHSLTLLVVVSVNIVIVFYICMALKEPADKHKPDAASLAEAEMESVFNRVEQTSGLRYGLLLLLL